VKILKVIQRIGQGYKTWEYYTCLDCGCEWEWVSEKTITKHGKEVEDE